MRSASFWPASLRFLNIRLFPEMLNEGDVRTESIGMAIGIVGGILKDADHVFSDRGGWSSAGFAGLLRTVGAGCTGAMKSIAAKLCAIPARAKVLNCCGIRVD